MVYPITVVGVGPGHEDYLVPAAKRAVEEADCLVGGSRAMALFQDLDKEKYIIDGQIDRLIPKLKKLRQRHRVAVLVSGDPGVYSLLSCLKKFFSPPELTVIPGISSIQLAFARIADTWQDAELISVHGRELEILLGRVKPGRTVAVLTDYKNNPGAVAAFLRGKVEGDPRVYICSSLSLEKERINSTKLSLVKEERGDSVMVIKYD